MRIGIDGRLLPYRRGIGNTLNRLLTAFDRLPGATAHEYLVYFPSRRTPSLPVGRAKWRWRTPPFDVPLVPVWEQAVLPALAARDELDLLHCPGNSAPIYLGQATPLVMTVHDAVFALPANEVPRPRSWYQRFGREYQRVVVPRAAAQAALVVTVSESSRRDLIRHLRMVNTPIEVVPNGPSFDEEAIGIAGRKSCADAPGGRAQGSATIVMFGASEPRKNVAGAIRAIEALRTRHSLDCRLVVLGYNGWRTSADARLASRYGLTDAVEFREYVPETDVLAALSGADALLCPSFYEGFGLPVLDAMFLGVPVVCSDRSSLPEVAGNGALMVDPASPLAMAEALRRILTEEPLRNTLVAAGRRRAERFRWATSGARWQELYASVARRHLAVQAR